VGVAALRCGVHKAVQRARGAEQKRVSWITEGSRSRLLLPTVRFLGCRLAIPDPGGAGEGPAHAPRCRKLQRSGGLGTEHLAAHGCSPRALHSCRCWHTTWRSKPLCQLRGWLPGAPIVGLLAVPGSSGAAALAALQEGDQGLIDLIGEPGAHCQAMCVASYMQPFLPWIMCWRGKALSWYRVCLTHVGNLRHTTTASANFRLLSLLSRL
jgi:hypothetical protein